MGTSIDWVPHAPTDPVVFRRCANQFARALNQRVRDSGCYPRFAVLHLTPEEKSLDHIDFDDVECGL